MNNRFAEARNRKGLKSIQAAELLGISNVTLSYWEKGQKTPGIESLIKMADLYECSVDYLLCRTEDRVSTPTGIVEIDLKMINLYHNRPVWSPKYGWVLVNAIESCLTAANGFRYRFDNIGALYSSPANYTVSPIPESNKELDFQGVVQEKTVWVEPISSDRTLAENLRGYYHLNGPIVENEFGQRFYLDNLGKDWLAFRK